MINVTTHNGTFHADDVFALAVLELIYGKNKINLTRTRDADIIANSDIKVDVGGIYDPDLDMFDHHQKGGAGERDNGVPYSSVGLVWEHYGSNICTNPSYVDKVLIQSLDAMDCGHSSVNGTNVYSISEAISSFNPVWNAEFNDYDKAFAKAVTFAKDILKNTIISANSYKDAEDRVLKAIELSQGSKVIVLDRFCPWTKTVVENAPNAEFVVFPDFNGEWRIQTIPVELDSFTARKNLPESWAGLRGQDLSTHLTIEGCVFCHIGRFIAGNTTKVGILQMAGLATK